VDEFEPLFADRLEGTLERLKASGGMPPSATLDDLRASILYWYDGYNWGGETRVLNPISILNFFKNAAFRSYWIQSGRPGHLSALIKARPMDCLAPERGSHLYAEVRRSEIDHLQAVPVLFHSGYLTLDKITPSQPPGPAADGASNLERLTFRLPNGEVESSYRMDCLEVILDLGSLGEVIDKGVKFREALLKRDFETIESELERLFSAINCHQRPDSEEDFRVIVKAFLMGLCLKVTPDVPGLDGGPDLVVELSDREYVIIGFRHLKCDDWHTRGVDDRRLASLARERFSDEEIERVLIDAAQAKPQPDVEKRLLSEERVLDSGFLNSHLRLSLLARPGLSPTEIISALAIKAREELPVEAEKAMRELARNFAHADKRIGDMLTKAAQGVLTDLASRGRYVVGRDAQNSAALGLAFFGYGDRVKAVFGPVLVRSPQRRNKPSRAPRIPKMRPSALSS
jgi:hypothetical protein